MTKLPRLKKNRLTEIALRMLARRHHFMSTNLRAALVDQIVPLREEVSDQRLLD